MHPELALTSPEQTSSSKMCIRDRNNNRRSHLHKGGKKPKMPHFKGKNRLFKILLAILLVILVIMIIVFLIKQQNPVNTDNNDTTVSTSSKSSSHKKKHHKKHQSSSTSNDDQDTYSFSYSTNNGGGSRGTQHYSNPVSYTHLDVYKRQDKYNQQ